MTNTSSHTICSCSSCACTVRVANIGHVCHPCLRGAHEHDEAVSDGGA